MEEREEAGGEVVTRLRPERGGGVEGAPKEAPEGGGQRVVQRHHEAPADDIGLEGRGPSIVEHVMGEAVAVAEGCQERAGLIVLTSLAQQKRKPSQSEGLNRSHGR